MYTMRQKFYNTGYPSPFTNSVIRDYEHKQNKRQDQEDKYIVPPNFFKMVKESILVEFQYCPQNELVAKRFLSTFHQLANQKFQVNIKLITKKVKSLFSLKDKNLYPACQIYKGMCVSDETYIGETIRNVDIHWNECKDTHRVSEPVKHLRENLNHKFKWGTLLQAAKNCLQRRNLEASFIAIMGPTLNNQLDAKKLYLFRNSVT